MTTKLPQINNRNRVVSPDTIKTKTSYIKDERLNRTLDKTNFGSPFKLPSDDEVFVYRELERKKREELKSMTQDLKIWDKKTGTTRKPLRQFKDFSSPEKEDSKFFLTSPGYNTHDKAMITEAQRIMKERKKEKELSMRDNKEGVLDLLEQKKEMFLVEMTVGIIEKERLALVNRISEKDLALKKSDEMLEKDWKEFETYKLTNKMETDQAIQKYNQEVEARKRTDTDYKIKNNELTSIKSDKLKNEELMQKYLEAKNFLTQLTPSDVRDQKQRLLEEKIEEVRTKWVDREVALREADNSFSGMVDAFVKASPKGDPKVALNAKRALRAEVERIFQEKLEKREIEEIEDYKLNEKMYFTDPDQLVGIYTRLEENNLAVIQTMQDTEQTLEIMRNSLKQRKADFDRQCSGLREHKQNLEKRKMERENAVKLLTQQARQPILSKNDGGLSLLRKKMVEICTVLKGDVKGGIDTENSSAIDLLEYIELQLEKQLGKLAEYKPTRVMELKKECEDERKRENRKRQQEKEQQLADERREKAMDRTREKSTKRQGRRDMVKSIPLEKKKVVEQVVVNTGEEEDIKYYKPYLTKY